MTKRSALRIPLLDLLSFILVPALGIAAMRAGGMFVTAALLLGMLWFIAASVAALFAKGELRKFAGGFVVAAGICGGLVLYFGPGEIEPHQGRLPTTHVIEPLREAVTTYTYFDAMSGRRLSESEVASG